MAKLTGQTIADSYDQLLIVDNANGITSGLQAIESADTGGAASCLKIATTSVGVIGSDYKLYLGDADGEYLRGDTDNLDIAAGTDINLNAGADINIPQNVGLTFGSATNPKIEGDGTDLAIDSTGNINITSTVNEVNCIYIQENAGTSGTIAIHANQGTDPASVNIVSDDGGITLNAELITMTLGGGTGDDFNVDSNTFVVSSDTNRVGIGTNDPGTQVEIRGASGDTTTGGQLTLSTAHTSIVNGDILGSILFQAPLENTGSTSGDQILPGAAIWAAASGGFSNTDNDTALHFATANGETAFADARIAMSIDNDGNVGIGHTTPSDAKLELTDVQSGDMGFQIENVQNSACINLEATISGDNNYRDVMLYMNAIEQNADAAFEFLRTYTTADTDIHHKLLGDGTSAQDGGTAWVSGADYAEYFETLDGKVIAPGITVVLVDGKIREAQEGEVPFGVTRPEKAPCALGNTAGFKWQGKYLKTPYGNYELDGEGTRILNPDFTKVLDEDGKQIYTPRSDRDEWEVVGLLGQIPVNNNQVISPSWIKMWKVTDDVDMYYVFPSGQVVNNNQQGESSNEQEE